MKPNCDNATFFCLHYFSSFDEQIIILYTYLFYRENKPIIFTAKFREKLPKQLLYKSSVSSNTRFAHSHTSIRNQKQHSAKKPDTTTDLNARNEDWRRESTTLFFPPLSSSITILSAATISPNKCQIYMSSPFSHTSPYLNKCLPFCSRTPRNKIHQSETEMTTGPGSNLHRRVHTKYKTLRLITNT